MSIETQKPMQALEEIETLEELLAKARSRIVSVSTAHNGGLAERVYRARRLRDLCFGDDAEVFGEPAWDMLLDLFCARAEQRQLSISSACIGAFVPTTTAMRRLLELEERGLVERHRDPLDRRRCFIALTDRATAIMGEWLDRTAPMLSNGPVKSGRH